MKYLIILLAPWSPTLSAQIICIGGNNTSYSAESVREFNKIKLRSPSDFKTVRVNFHFMLRSKGTGNFTETGDNLNNDKTGYTFAKDMIDVMNFIMSYNQPMNIPPNNTIAVLDKNIGFVLDAVYFHRNDNWSEYPNGYTAYNAVGADRTEVMNVFLTNDNSSVSARGYVINTGQFPVDKFTENTNYWRRYADFVNGVYPGDQYYWGLSSSSGQTVHEICHLFGLDHTVLYNDGFPCGYNQFCDDDCTDTPSALSILTDPNNTSMSPPNCGWQSSTNPWCSSNLMDYNGGNSLSPCQINIVHTGLEAGLKSFTSCDAVRTDEILNDIGYPKVSYFGRNVTLGTSTFAATLKDNEEATIYFSNEVRLNNISIDGSFEIFFQVACD
jgi:hypothetical protein